MSDFTPSFSVLDFRNRSPDDGAYFSQVAMEVQYFRMSLRHRKGNRNGLPKQRPHNSACSQTVSIWTLSVGYCKICDSSQQPLAVSSVAARLILGGVGVESPHPWIKHKGLQGSKACLELNTNDVQCWQVPFSSKRSEREKPDPCMGNRQSRQIMKEHPQVPSLQEDNCRQIICQRYESMFSSGQPRKGFWHKWCIVQWG